MKGPVIHKTSPQIAQPAGISSIMLDVIVALLPALAMSVFLFGPRVLALSAVSVGTCVLAEYGYRRLRGQENTIGDLSLSSSFTAAWAGIFSTPPWRAGRCCVPFRG